jgi:hypothetical protein
MKKYKVSWADPACPEIVRTTPLDPEGVSLAKARRQVLDTVQSQLSHWREIARKVRALRAGAIGKRNPTITDPLRQKILSPEQPHEP